MENLFLGTLHPLFALKVIPLNAYLLLQSEIPYRIKTNRNHKLTSIYFIKYSQYRIIFHITAIELNEIYAYKVICLKSYPKENNIVFLTH
jgi:hypothetical protein